MLFVFVGGIFKLDKNEKAGTILKTKIEQRAIIFKY